MNHFLFGRRGRQELRSALKYKVSAKQMLEEMRTVIEQQQAAIREAQYQQAISIPPPPPPPVVMSDAAMNTEPFVDPHADENRMMRYQIRDLQIQMTHTQTKYEEERTAREVSHRSRFAQLSFSVLILLLLPIAGTGKST